MAVLARRPVWQYREEGRAERRALWTAVIGGSLALIALVFLFINASEPRYGWRGALAEVSMDRWLFVTGAALGAAVTLVFKISQADLGESNAMREQRMAALEEWREWISLTEDARLGRGAWLALAELAIRQQELASVISRAALDHIQKALRRSVDASSPLDSGPTDSPKRAAYRPSRLPNSSEGPSPSLDKPRVVAEVHEQGPVAPRTPAAPELERGWFPEDAWACLNRIAGICSGVEMRIRVGGGDPYGLFFESGPLTVPDEWTLELSDLKVGPQRGWALHIQHAGGRISLPEVIEPRSTVVLRLSRSDLRKSKDATSFQWNGCVIEGRLILLVDAQVKVTMNNVTIAKTGELVVALFHGADFQIDTAHVGGTVFVTGQNPEHFDVTKAWVCDGDRRSGGDGWGRELQRMFSEQKISGVRCKFKDVILQEGQPEANGYGLGRVTFHRLDMQGRSELKLFTSCDPSIGNGGFSRARDAIDLDVKLQNSDLRLKTETGGLHNIRLDMTGRSVCDLQFPGPEDSSTEVSFDNISMRSLDGFRPELHIHHDASETRTTFKSGVFLTGYVGLEFSQTEGPCHEVVLGRDAIMAPIPATYSNSQQGQEGATNIESRGRLELSLKPDPNEITVVLQGPQGEDSAWGPLDQRLALHGTLPENTLGLEHLRPLPRFQY